VIPLGGAVQTGAGKLPFKAIIHVAGIGFLWTASEHSIRDSVVNAINLAKQNGYCSIAMPLIGAGTGGIREAKTLTIIQQALAGVEFDGEVRIVRYRRK
jgi:O-acetyl-ADP-ribose deacetylase